MSDVSVAIRHLRAGGLVAFPTETVYGLGACAADQGAVARVFALKGRPSNNPLIVHVSGGAMARGLVSSWPEEAERLVRAFWPGPLTLVLPRNERVPEIVTAGGAGVALRSPDHPLTLALLFELGEGIVGPSANRSGYVSPTTAEHVFAEFPEVADECGGEGADGRPAGIDRLLVLRTRSAARVGIESTVVSLMDAGREAPVILRQGMVTPEEIGEVLGVMPRVREGLKSDVAGGGALESPGMLAKHYAPRTRATMLDSDGINELLRETANGEGRFAVLARSLTIEVGEGHVLIAMPPTAEGFAAALYGALREADAAGVSRILIEEPPRDVDVEGVRERSLWGAVRDRLARATSA